MSKSKQEAPEAESGSRWKELREWCALVFGVIATLLALLSYHQANVNEDLSRKNKKLESELAIRSRRAEMEKSLSAAWDRLGGKSGTTVIVDFAKDPDQLELARREIEEVLIRDPQNPEAYRIKGVYLESIGNLREAVKAYQLSIRLDPHSAPSQINMGVALDRLKDHDGAIRAFRAAEKIGTHNDLAYLNLAVVYREEGLNADADQLLKSAIALLTEKKGMFAPDVLARLTNEEEYRHALLQDAVRVRNYVRPEARESVERVRPEAREGPPIP